MPRYFFHVHDDIVARDPEGVELPDLAAARACAIEGARSLMMTQVEEGRIHLDHWIEVTDQDDREVMRVPFSEAVTVTGGRISP